MSAMWVLRCLVCAVLMQVIVAAPFLSLDVDKENCGECATGYEPRTLCNETHDTECTPCPRGYFSDQPGYSKCMKCSHCQTGYFQFDPCTHTADTFCEKCTFMYDFDNVDYSIRCNNEGNIVKQLVKRRSQMEYFDVSLTDDISDEYLPSELNRMVRDSPGSDEYDAYDDRELIDEEKDGVDVVKEDTSDELKDNEKEDDGESSGEIVNRLFSTDGSGEIEVTGNVGLMDGSGEVDILTTEGYTEEGQETTDYTEEGKETTDGFVPILKTRNPGYKAEAETDTELPLEPVTNEVTEPVTPTPEVEEKEEVGNLGKKQEKVEDEGLPVLAIVITIIVVGFVFFVIGFAVYRIKKRRSHTIKHPVYEVAATTDKDVPNATEMVNMNDTKKKVPTATLR